MKNTITVIIPAYNEEKSIGNVIKKIKQEQIIEEIIVVANSCTDKTKDVALKAGAKVYSCNKKGKGYAMDTGIKKSKGDILVFLDADIDDYIDNIVTIMASPIINNQADFVKSKFSREGGRVTELTAKPLLKLLFPELPSFSQPLSGMIACKKKILKNLFIEKDYGVDIGILLDVLKMGVTVKEQSIGNITNNSKDWKSLTTMSKEVAAAILKRADYVEYSDTDKLYKVSEMAI